MILLITIMTTIMITIVIICHHATAEAPGWAATGTAPRTGATTVINYGIV